MDFQDNQDFVYGLSTVRYSHSRVEVAACLSIVPKWRFFSAVFLDEVALPALPLAVPFDLDGQILALQQAGSIVEVDLGGHRVPEPKRAECLQGLSRPSLRGFCWRNVHSEMSFEKWLFLPSE